MITTPPFLVVQGIPGNKKGPQRGLRVSASKRMQTVYVCPLSSAKDTITIAISLCRNAKTK
jgi:hypothetical protein